MDAHVPQRKGQYRLSYFIYSQNQAPVPKGAGAFFYFLANGVVTIFAICKSIESDSLILRTGFAITICWTINNNKDCN